MSSDDVVRITHSELTNLSQQYDKSSTDKKMESQDDGNRRRRPAMQIYQPRLRRPGGSGDSSNSPTTPPEPSSEACKDSEEFKEDINISGQFDQIKMEDMSQSRDDKSSRRQKKPDLQRYIPRHRHQTQQGRAESQGSMSEDPQTTKISPDKELERRKDVKPNSGYDRGRDSQSRQGRGRGRRGGRGSRDSLSDRHGAAGSPGIEKGNHSFELDTDVGLEWDYQEISPTKFDVRSDPALDSNRFHDQSWSDNRPKKRNDGPKPNAKEQDSKPGQKRCPASGQSSVKKREENTGPTSKVPVEGASSSADSKVDINIEEGTFLGTLVITNSKFENHGEGSRVGDTYKQTKDSKSLDDSNEHKGNQRKQSPQNRRQSDDNYRRSSSGGQRSNPSRYSETKARQRRRSGEMDRGKRGPREEVEQSYKREEKEALLPDPPGSNSRGILHLPASSQAMREPTYHQHSAPAPHHMRGRGRGRSRGSHRSLYDPNNPSKPMPVPSQQSGLRFHDSYDSQQSPDNQFHQPAEYGYSPIVGPYPNVNNYRDREYTVVGSPHGHGDNHHHPDYSHPGLHHDEPALVDDTYARDPHYHRETEQDIKSSSRSANHAKADALLRDATPLDSQLNNLLSRRVHGLDGWKKVLSIRREVQHKYEQVVLLDPDLSNKQNVEQLLWRSAYYQVIEVLRRMLAEDAEEESGHKDMLLNLLEEATTFYEHLLQSLQNVYGFVLDDFLDPNQLPPDNLSRSVKLALLSAQRCMICLGDIARYKEQTHHTSNYGKARSWYLKAQQLAPKNGRPYNQLAILALYTRRKLDAVYYYMRSLAASNPFLTARESIMALFDEARKKVEHTERKRTAAQAAKLRLQKKTSGYGGGRRIEIWVAADGKSSSDSVQDDGDEDDITHLSDVELNKRFVLSFLNVQGKLFTKIGMEMYPEVRWQALREFQQLLEHVPVPIGNVRLLQLVTINMFAIENTSPKDIPLEEGCRSLHQESAVRLGLDMFAHLCRRCAVLLREHVKSGDYQILGEDLRQLVPSVKVWSDWMTCHVDLWNPPPQNTQPMFRCDVDVWEAIADLCNVLKDVDTSYVKLYPQRKEGCDPVLLGEDALLAGFVPLLGRPLTTNYVHATVDKEVAKDCLRVERLCIFGDYLCGIEPPLLSYNVQTRMYESCISHTDNSPEPDPLLISGAYSDEDGEVQEMGVLDNSDEVEGEHVRELRQRKLQLQQQLQHQERHERSIRAVLDSSSESQRLMEISVRPMLLVPDTNCFIDHLPALESLLDSAAYTIVVPLVVINELDGLSQGSREGQYSTEDHASMVRDNAAAAVSYLERQFSAKNSHLRALTSKGTVMETINFRSEDMSGKRGNNDDMILACCMHYCQDKARDFMPTNHDEPIKLHREVVLLTDDRNLRLKAHMRNVPVKTVPAFSSWAHVS